MSEAVAIQPVESREYDRFSLTPFAGALGAEIRDIDVNELDDATFEQLYGAWLEYQVLSIREQELTPSQQIAFARRFGEIQEHLFDKGIEGHPEIVEILKTEDQTRNIGPRWHTDQQYRPEPAKATILYAREIPPVGGDTCFANGYLGYETLSEGLKTALAGMKAVSDGDSRNHPTGMTRKERVAAGIAPIEQKAEAPEDLSFISEHPVVRTHPETGRKSLYIGNHTQHFAGWSEAESKPLLDFLKLHNGQPHHTCRVKWQPGTITVWDNRCCLHMALNDYHGYRRRVHKILIKGDKPF
jgi:taurine dioxygenase